jgi:ketosteroid isomerase-like protein
MIRSRVCVPLFAIGLLAIAACVSVRVSPSVGVDRAAILAVIDASARAYATRNWDAYAQYWEHSDRIELVQDVGTRWLVGWDTVMATVRRVAPDSMQHYSLTPILRKVRISESQDLAWVTEELKISVQAGGHTSHLTQRATYGLAKKKKWRLVHAHISPETARRDSSP